MNLLALIQSKKRLLITLLLIVIAIIWYGPFLLSNKVGIFDWEKDLFFYEFLKDSLSHFKEFPISFIRFSENAGVYPTPNFTASYIANPEVLTFSPLIILLYILPVIPFLKIYFIMHIFIGILGIHLLSRRFSLNSLSTILFALLTLLNPWLMQHLAIGYIPWITACYIPLLVWFILKGFEDKKYLIAAFLLNALIFYEGGIHVFNWLNGSILLFTLFYVLLNRNWRSLKNIFLYFLGSFLLVLPKLWVVMQVFKGFRQSVIESYQSFQDLFGLLTDLRVDLYDIPKAYDIYNTVIYDASIGVGSFFLILLLVLLFYYFRNIKTWSIKERSMMNSLLLSAATLVLIGWNDIWKFFVDKVNLLETEKYPFRFLFLAIIFLSVFMVFVISKVANRRYLVIIIVLIMLTASVYFTRVQYFNSVATATENLYVNFDLEKFYNEKIEGSGPESYIKISPSEVIVRNDSEKVIILNWMSSNHIKDFDVEGGKLEVKDSKVILIPDQNHIANINLKARSLGFYPLILISLIITLIYSLFVSRGDIFTSYLSLGKEFKNSFLKKANK